MPRPAVHTPALAALRVKDWPWSSWSHYAKRQRVCWISIRRRNREAQEKTRSLKPKKVRHPVKTASPHNLWPTRLMFPALTRVTLQPRLNWQYSRTLS